MKKALILLGVLIVVGVFAAAIFLEKNKTVNVSVNNFEECTAAGYPVMESYPRQCQAADGNNFIEDIGNELAKADLIKLANPRPNQAVKSPLLLEGQARGSWYFEASFPVKLYDKDNNLITQAVAQAQGDWMTTDFVSFKAELTFALPATKTGFLVLEKDNPSDLPGNQDQLRLPVKF